MRAQQQTVCADAQLLCSLIRAEAQFVVAVVLEEIQVAGLRSEVVRKVEIAVLGPSAKSHGFLLQVLQCNSVRLG